MLEITTIILIVIVLLVPVTIVRIIVGLPLLAFLPGYALLSALFSIKNRLNGLEQITICFGMSIAISALLGLGLNYTPWGITLESVLYSLAAFIIVMSNIALFIQWRSLGKVRFFEIVDIKLPGWEGNSLNKSLSIIAIISVLTTCGVLSYTVLVPKIGEKFSDFYLLGLNGKANNYPTTLYFEGNQIKGVVYGATEEPNQSQCQVIVGIINHEQQTNVYSLQLIIDGKPSQIEFGNTTTELLDNIILKQGEKWQNTIGFVPDHVGDNQKVEFILLQGSENIKENSLYLWIDVKEAD
jgi:uncharacterized membrane protein